MVDSQATGPSPHLLSRKEIQDFELALKRIVMESVELNDPDPVCMLDMKEWAHKVFDYNLRTGDKNRRLLLPMAYKFFAKNTISEENLEQVYAVGWILELVQAAEFVVDDLIDQNLTRNGYATWGKVNGTETLAVNDTLMLRMASLQLLEKYFGGPLYFTLYKCIRDAMASRIIGRLLNDQYMKKKWGGGKLQDRYTMDWYSTIIRRQVSNPSISLPIKVAMVLADNDEMDADTMETVEDIVCDMGLYLQVREDFEEIFSGPQFENEENDDTCFLDKMRTDFKNKNWSWLLVQAAELCDGEQFQRIVEHFQDGDLKALNEEFERLDLRRTYEEYRKEVLARIVTKVRSLPEGSIKQFFTELIR